MGEGLLRSFGDNDFDAFSAGSAPHGINPQAVQVMGEIGIDIAQQRSKHLNEFQGQPFDYVITLCDSAHEGCPPCLAIPSAFSGAIPTRLRWLVMRKHSFGHSEKCVMSFASGYAYGS
jgi:hypothetical protein